MRAAPPANGNSFVAVRRYTLFDAAISYSILDYRLQLRAEDLFNTQWNEGQYDTESARRTKLPPISELHFSPTTPLKVKVKYHF